MRMSQRAFVESAKSRYGGDTISGPPGIESADFGLTRREEEPVCVKPV